MNLQAPIGSLHPDPTMLAIDRALHDDLLDSDLHREIVQLPKRTILLALKFSPLTVIQTSITAPETLHYYFCAHVLSLCFRLYF